MRRLLLLLGLVLAAAPVAAQPTLGSVAAFKTHVASATTTTIANVDSGNGIVVIVTQTGDSARTYTISDECPNAYGAPAVTSPAYGSGRATAAWIVYSSACTDASLVITVTQAGGSVASYSIIAFEVAGTLAADTTSSKANSATVAHPASASAETIDTANEVFVFSACVSNGSLGTETVATGWTAFTESSTSVMAQYRTSATALTDQRGEMSSTTARSTQCVIGSIKDSGATAPSISTHYVCAAGDATCGGTPAYSTIGAALTAADDGDVVCLKPGETFEQSTVTIPDKSALDAPITIRSCADDADLPPSGVRITPAYNDFLPIWKSDTNNTAAVDFETSAQDYIIKFIRFQCDPVATQDVVRFGFNDSTQQFESEQPDNLTLDQVIIEGDTIKGCKRGVSLHGSNLTVKNSYFTKINSVGQDGQCVWGANGTGPYTIQNNYCDGSTEPVMFGGTDNQMRTNALCADSPAPTTTGCTLENFRVGHTIATLSVGQIIAIQTGAAAREHPRVATINGDVVTWTPALTVAPTDANCGTNCDVRWGVMPADALIERNHFTRPANYWLPAVGTPTNLAVAMNTAAGSLAAGSYCYRVNAIAPGYAGNNSFSTPSQEVCGTLDTTGQAVVTWTAVTDATKYRVYGRSSGGQNRYWEVSAPTVTYTDTGTAGTTSSVPAGTTFQVKNAYEHKFGNRFTVRHNIFENVRSSLAGDGTAVWLKSGNSDNSSEFSETSDFLFENNVIRHAAACIKFSSAEEGGTDLERPVPITGMTVRHNLCYDVGPQWSHTGLNVATSAVSDYGLAMHDFTFEHNTMLGVRYAMYFQSNTLGGTNALRSNVFPATTFGMRADGIASGSATLAAYNIGTFANNLLAGISLSAYPSTTLTISQAALEAAMVEYGGADITDYAFDPGSIYLTAAHDGTMVGADIAAIATGVEGVAQGLPSGAPIFTTTTLPNATVSTPYAVTILTTGGTGAHTFSLASGSLPPGITLSPTGVLGGTPTAETTATFGVTATDTLAMATTQAFSLTVAAASVTAVEVTTTALSGGTVSAPYTATLEATGGPAAYVWSLALGSLPPGLALAPGSGIISGLPQSTGLFSFRVRVASGSLVDTQDLTIAISSGGVPTGPLNPSPRATWLSHQELRTFVRDDCAALTPADDVNVRDLCVDPDLNVWVVEATAPALTIRNLAGRLRESFDQGYFIMENDATAKSVTDNAVNVVFGSPLGILHYHEEVTKTASSWVIADGVLDIKGDNDADNEGVEIRVGSATTTEGWIVAQASGACFAVNLTLGDISGTDQLLIGWVQNEAFSATNAYAGYSDWSLVGVNNVDGSIFSLAEVEGGGTLSDDSGVNMADGETRTLKSCVLANGTRTASYTDHAGTTFTDITLTNGVTAHTAGDQLLPMITFLSAGTDGASPTINWMEVWRLP